MLHNPLGQIKQVNLEWGGGDLEHGQLYCLWHIINQVWLVETPPQQHKAWATMRDNKAGAYRSGGSVLAGNRSKIWLNVAVNILL